MHVSHRGCHLTRAALLICVSAVAACMSRSSGPTEPSPANTNATRGTVVESLTGTPIEGATVSFTQNGTLRTLTTSDGGVWDLVDSKIDGMALLEVAAAGYVTRRTFASLVTSQNQIVIDLIRDAAPFSLTYYRQLVRNQFDDPGTLQPLRRWTKNPNFYIDTRNPRAGGEMSTDDRESIIGIVRAAVAQMTGGQLAAGTIEVGSGARNERSGVVNMSLVDDPGNEFCGWSRVGTDPGSITINLASRCDTPCGVIAPRTVAHEVAHALGFYHVERGDILSTNWSHRDCGTTTFSSTELHHARLAYARKPGNRDTDSDPVLSLFVETPDPPRLIGCR
jgi:hypothetical protein